MQGYKKGFSLIEILVGILIISSIMIAAFQALSSVGIAKVKLIEQTEIEKQAYFSSERFFELIKKGGTLDYEEYWNRYSYDLTYLSGSFANHSGFGNYGTAGNPGQNSPTYGGRIYNCVSNGTLMGTGGCLETNNLSFNNSAGTNRRADPQRYGQYELQFIDRNSDNDSDSNGAPCTGPDGSPNTGVFGDEDCDGSVLGDDDDLFLGIGPVAFSGTLDTNSVGELYLISNDGSERTYFRWRVEEITSSGFIPTGATICDVSTNPEKPSGDTCQGTIEMLKLTGVDYGFNHDNTPNGRSLGDGIIDTWFIHEDFASGDSTIIAGSNTENYWQPIFPSTINISDFEIYAYPNKDINLSWRDSSESILIAPYIQIKYTIQPSLQVKAKIRGESPSVEISTTIGLSTLDIK